MFPTAHGIVSQGGKGAAPAPGDTELAFHFAADTLTVADGASIPVWPDLSGHGRDGSSPFANRQPILLHDELNGLPVARFDGSNDRLDFSTSDWADALRAADGASLAAVVKMSSTGTRHVFLVSTSGSIAVPILTIRQASGDIIVESKQSPGGPHNILEGGAFGTGWRLITASIDFINGKATLREEGVETAALTELAETGATPDEPSLIVRMSGSGQVNPSGTFGGDLAELKVWKGALTPSQLASEEATLATKWGISL